MTVQQNNSSSQIWLRRFSKITAWATWCLIFIGGMVTSTGSGLSVPDWPLSYGSFFPPMIGGVFYEHGHRMVASLVGFLILCLAIWLARNEKRRWVRNLGWAALIAVILQGVLGGITVLLYLPAAVSVAHGVLAQTLFILTIVMAYSQSKEHALRRGEKEETSPVFLKWAFILTAFIYVQLLLGAIMRHTESGLAIYDFPTMGGYWWPPFNETMLNKINYWRFEHNLNPITMTQVVYNFLHRLGAGFIFITSCVVTLLALKYHTSKPRIMRSVYLLNSLVILQITLGILTILTQKQPIITSFHVMIGAGVLGISTLLILRASPLTWTELRKTLSC